MRRRGTGCPLRRFGGVFVALVLVSASPALALPRDTTTLASTRQLSAFGRMALPSFDGWTGLGSSGPGVGAINGGVYALAVSGADLFVGGTFTNGGGVGTADYIARWRGSAWSGLGSNGSGGGALNGEVRAIVASGGNLYVGGGFTDAGGIATADYVAMWNGSSWSALGSNGPGVGALDGEVQAMAVSGGNLYVGGTFTDAGGVTTADYVAMWNGAAWSGLGSTGPGVGAIRPMPDSPAPSVFSLAMFDGALYVGGVFVDVSGDAASDSIARWSGGVWSSVGSGDPNCGDGPLCSGVVYAMVVAGPDLYVGGSWLGNGDPVPHAENLWKWSGSAWSAVGPAGLSGGPIREPVYALAASGTNLYVGGNFSDAAGIREADRIAMWNRGTGVWSALDPTGEPWWTTDGVGAFTDDVSALAVSASTGTLYAGGSFFDVAGIAVADRVARLVIPVCQTRQATQIGNAGANVITGTGGVDVIMGFGRGDTINGLGGDDLICAGGGADLVHGGDGRDTIYGDGGADTLYGDEQSDLIYGGNGDDILLGNGGGRDRLFGGNGIDNLNGGAGTDDRCTTGETYAACEVVF